MRGLGSRSVALLLLALSGASAGLTAGRHAHGFGERDLRTHELAYADSERDCDAAPHLDRARADRHPACAACVALRSPVDRARLDGASLRRPVSLKALTLADDAAGQRRAGAWAWSGRAPPRAAAHVDS